MSLYKRCSRSVPEALRGGDPNPFYCSTSPRCEHPWHYDFRLSGRRYRASTDTHEKAKAKDIEAKERSRILDGRHGIRRQPAITFRAFAKTYLTDHAEMHKRDRGVRDREIIARLDGFFGSLILHEITAHRIEQWKRERLQGRWQARGQRSRAKPVQPGTVNRELDLIKSILAKAVEWGKLIDSPARTVRRLRVENRRTRILSVDEERRLVEHSHGKFRSLVALALLTGARLGELLALRWEHVSETELVFLETKNGKSRRLPLTPAIRTLLEGLPRIHPYVFTNPRTGRPFTSIGKNFERALDRAEISTGDVTFHTLRHTALSRMIAAGHSDHTVMAISGHSTTRMLERYTHPTQALQVSALSSGDFLATNWPQTPRPSKGPDPELRELLRKSGGRREDRTRDLRVANAALSQLS
jgi:integrase